LENSFVIASTEVMPEALPLRRADGGAGGPVFQLAGSGEKAVDGSERTACLAEEISLAQSG
jgi:hypothetical protein